MSFSPRILAFAGSLRKDSWNKKLVRVAAAQAQAAGAAVTLIELNDFMLPLFSEDDESEHGLPENARRLKDLMQSHQGFLISSPEYNSSITPLLKNTIDWASRPAAGEPRLACFAGKAALLVSASPGALGGIRGLVHLRAILCELGTLVLPSSVSISKAHEAFAPDGTLADARLQQKVAGLAAELASFLRRHHSA